MKRRTPKKSSKSAPPGDSPDLCDFFTHSDPIMPISVVAKKLGVSVSTIRLYEKEGLLGVSRSPSGRRLYSMNDVLLAAKVIQLIRERGLNFAGVRAFFSQIRCWEVVHCPPEQRESCSAFTGQLAPCWSNQTEGCARKEESCENCPVFNCVAQASISGLRFAMLKAGNSEEK